MAVPWAVVPVLLGPGTAPREAVAPLASLLRARMGSPRRPREMARALLWLAKSEKKSTACGGVILTDRGSSSSRRVEVLRQLAVLKDGSLDKDPRSSCSRAGRALRRGCDLLREGLFLVTSDRKTYHIGLQRVQAV